MNKELLKGISIAGLFHDIGKFAERAYAVDPGDPDMVRQEYNYGHAFSTEQALKKLFSEEILSRSLRNSMGVQECTILNLAARHHKSRHAYEIIVSEADRIASGHERAGSDEESGFETSGHERKSQVPLLSILGRVHLPDRTINPASKNMRYRITMPLLENEMEQSIVFPVLPEKYPARQVREDYKKHWQDFVNELSSQNGLIALDIKKQFDTIFEICRMYLWCLPASARKEEIEDVSLFEHQKATAALAACLYCYHEEKRTLDEQAIRNKDKKKYLLFCGDISGIQSFIYRISSKGAYKTLKGRSFFIQLLAEMLARKYIERFSLTPANILYASGGKFYLLLPNTDSVADELPRLKDSINHELLKRFNGDVYVRTGQEPLSKADLTRQSGRTLSHIWDDLGRKLVFEDRRRYACLARNHYDDLFGIGNKAKTASCTVCHSAMHPKEEGHEQKCRTCWEMESIGRELDSASYIVMADNGNTFEERSTLELLDKHFWFLDSDVVESGGLSPHYDCLVWALNNTDFAKLTRIKSLSIINAAPMVVGGTHGFQKEFQEIASESEGVQRLGVLRMDVDSLGRIFNHGLKHYLHGKEKDGYRFYSLGRITTLSWQLSLFFGALVPGIIRGNQDWKDRVTVVYSGGDDLFLLGAWHALPEVALTIRKQFADFSCNNPSFTLSGGMVMTGGKFPIYKSAEMAGEAEAKAKKHIAVFQEEKGETEEKNSFTFLDTPMHWKEFEAVSGMKNDLYPLLREKDNRPLLNRLRDIASSWAESRDRLLRNGGMQSIEHIRRELMAEKWRWRMVYSLSRFGQNRQSIQEVIEKVQQFILNSVAETNRNGIELLGLLSRWCELQLRKPENRKGGE
ncbi:MAG: type III-A CRISPR-associated protein Cas10/Csm1 [Deltaproteobacteria bacterium]|nr:type III-A CRISPR-associated protein Cas10/Csm1 [Deltaproteobacteria bacterium]MBW2020964.1 type III-A CRISPR-associated protein Cas10/Csm1 [Deltaproteobacteria bacterium]MBW2098672.1 type III-A CRISPR-associated protein Cas10/Csm1 [Deltaproteobacteria bacterium]